MFVLTSRTAHLARFDEFELATLGQMTPGSHKPHLFRKFPSEPLISPERPRVKLSRANIAVDDVPWFTALKRLQHKLLVRLEGECLPPIGIDRDCFLAKFASGRELQGSLFLKCFEEVRNWTSYCNHHGGSV